MYLVMFCCACVTVGMMVNMFIVMGRNETLANEVNRLTMELERKNV